MVFYLIAAIVILTILIYIVTEVIHLPKKKFKKYIKFFFLTLIICIVLFLMRFFPAVITSIPAVFLILFRWGNFFNFIAKFQHRTMNVFANRYPRILSTVGQSEPARPMAVQSALFPRAIHLWPMPE